MARPAHACSNCGAEIEFPVKMSDQLVQCLACGGNIYQVMTQAADPPLQPPTDVPPTVPEPAIGSMFDHPAAAAYQPQTATATPHAPQERLERKVENATIKPPKLFWALSYIYTTTLKNIQGVWGVLLIVPVFFYVVLIVTIVFRAGPRDGPLVLILLGPIVLLQLCLIICFFAVEFGKNQDKLNKAKKFSWIIAFLGWGFVLSGMVGGLLLFDKVVLMANLAKQGVVPNVEYFRLIEEQVNFGFFGYTSGIVGIVMLTLFGTFWRLK